MYTHESVCVCVHVCVCVVGVHMGGERGSATEGDTIQLTLKIFITMVDIKNINACTHKPHLTSKGEGVRKRGPGRG